MAITDQITEYSPVDEPSVRVYGDPNLCTVEYGFMSHLGTHKSLGRLVFPDPNTARVWLDEALSRVVPLCMTTEQVVQDAADAA